MSSENKEMLYKANGDKITIVCGAHDHVASPEQSLPLIKTWTGIPDHRVFVLESGHTVMIEAADELNRIISDVAQMNSFF